MIRKKILCMTLVIFTIFGGLSTITAVAGEPPLVITYPSSVNELSTFWVDANIQADITFNGVTKTGTHVSFQAPPISGGDKTLYIDARSHSDPSNSDMNNPIIIKDYLKMYISSVSPTIVEEGGSFKVTVKDQSNIGLVGATVSLVGFNSGTTGMGGVVTFTAPSINIDTTIEITASKDGYDFTGGSKFITVKNLALSFSGVPSQINENQLLTGRVLDQNGAPVKSASINFGGNTANTDSNGYFSVLAPLVENNEIITLTANKKKNGIDYIPATKDIQVLDIFENIAQIRCIVKDVSGNPLDALVQFILGDDQQAQTGEDGIHDFEVEPEQSGTWYILKITCEGYSSQYKLFKAYVTDYFEWTFNLQEGIGGETVEGQEVNQQPSNK